MLLRTNTNNWNPWREISRLQGEMNRLFNDTTGWQTKPFPAVNIWAGNDEMILMTELPGLKQENIHISIMNDELTIEGNRKQEALKNGELFHRQERRHGQFKRSITIPFSIESEKVEANMKNGLLTIKLPRAESDKPKQIKIS